MGCACGSGNFRAGQIQEPADRPGRGIPDLAASQRTGVATSAAADSTDMPGPDDKGLVVCHSKKNSVHISQK